MYRAFDTLIRNGRVPSVGEVVLAVVHDEAGFRYSGGAVMMPGYQSIPSGRWTPVHFGTAGSGGFGYVVIKAEGGIPAVGLHFPHAQMGALFYPAKMDEPVVFKSVTQPEFCTRVEQDFGFELLPDVSVN